MTLITPPPNLGQVQSVGDFSIIASHPLVDGGAQIDERFQGGRRRRGL